MTPCSLLSHSGMTAWATNHITCSGIIATVSSPHAHNAQISSAYMMLSLRLFLLLALLSFVGAFSPVAVRTDHKAVQQRQTRATVKATRLLEDSVQPSTTISSSRLPAWVHLPASKQDNVELKELQRVELMIGRLAMFGAIGLIGKELVTGQSFAEQFLDLVTSVTSTV